MRDDVFDGIGGVINPPEGDRRLHIHHEFPQGTGTPSIRNNKTLLEGVKQLNRDQYQEEGRILIGKIADSYGIPGSFTTGEQAINAPYSGKLKYEDRKRKKKSPRSRRKPRRSRNTRRKPRRSRKLRRSRNTRRKPRRSKKPRRSRNTRRNLKGRADPPSILPSIYLETAEGELPPPGQALAPGQDSGRYSLNQVVYSPDIEHPPAEGFPPVKPDEETRGTHKNKELLEGMVANEESGGGSEVMAVEIPGFGVPGDDFSQGGTEPKYQLQPRSGEVVVDLRTPLLRPLSPDRRHYSIREPRPNSDFSDFSVNPFSLPAPRAPGATGHREKKNPIKATPTPTPTIKKSKKPSKVPTPEEEENPTWRDTYMSPNNIKKLKKWLEKEGKTAADLRQLNQNTKHSGRLMKEIFPHDRIYPENLQQKKKKRIYAESLNSDESFILALAILEKYPSTKVIYGIK